MNTCSNLVKRPMFSFHPLLSSLMDETQTAFSGNPIRGWPEHMFEAQCLIVMGQGLGKGKGKGKSSWVPSPILEKDNRSRTILELGL